MPSGSPAAARWFVLVWAVFAATVTARPLAPAWHSDLEHVPLLVVAGLCAWAGGRRRTGRGALGWKLVSAAWLGSAVGLALYFLARSTGVAQLQTVGDALWNLYYPLAVAGLIALWGRASGRGVWLRLAVEGLTVALGTGLLAWYFVGRHVDAVGLATVVTNTVGEMALMMAASVLLSRQRSEPAARMLVMGTLLATVSDLIGAGPVTPTGKLYSDVFLYAAAALIATSGLRPGGPRRRLSLASELVLRGLGHLPTGVTLAVLLVLVHQAGVAGDATERLLAIGAAVIAGFFLLAVALAHYTAELEEDARTAQTERLSSAQRLMTLGQLTGSAVHDLNNLLVVLEDVADRLRAREPGAATTLELEQVTARVTTLCHELLTVGRPKGGQTTELGTVAHELESLLARVVSRALTFQLDVEGPLPVMGDRAQLEMALVNLVSNARDATSEGEVVVTAASKLVLDGDWFAKRGAAPGRWAALSVRDTGVGMSPEVVAHVFDAFFTTKGSRGTGLGLAQVAEFSRQAGGHTLIDSTPGAGTTVWLLLRPA